LSESNNRIIILEKSEYVKAQLENYIKHADLDFRLNSQNLILEYFIAMFS
ncbi:9198_t:CDS:1, partial [Gigaspora margarita]